MERITSKKIYSERPDLEKLAMEHYPLSKDEIKGCVTAKAIRDHMRFEWAKKLYESETGIVDTKEQN